ncbi:gatase1 [Caudoviricetes sp.]|nr:gatase1 [Caudoviricetes sp.]
MKKPLVLWGGVDISPTIYKQKSLSFTQRPDKERDYVEITAIEEHINGGIPIVGVCRGAQLLCAVNGGTLYQHSEPHNHNHSLSTLDGKIFERVSAGHHQIMRPAGDFVLHAWNPSPVLVWKDEENKHFKNNTAEVVYWPKTKCLAIQPHPEWAGKPDPFVIWINSLMKELEIDYEF